MCLNIRSVNMPFGDIGRPSIELTQLAEQTRRLRSEKVAIDIKYLNHEFGRLFGPKACKYITTHQSGLVSGFGAWFFRQVAFPELPEKREAYLTRFGHYFGLDVLQWFKRDLQPLRNRLADILGNLIDKYGLDQADIIGLSSTFLKNLASIALARRLRLLRPDQSSLWKGMGIELVAHVPMIVVFSAPALILFPLFVRKIKAQFGDALDAVRRKRLIFSERARVMNIVAAFGQEPRPTADAFEVGRSLPFA